MKIFYNAYYCVFLIIILFGCEPSVEQQNQDIVRRTLDQRLGTHFSEVSSKHFKPPNVTRLEFPITSEGSVLWGGHR
jgi:hypothetical protein